MSDKVNKERGKRKSFSVYWAKFLKVHSRFSSYPICIVEGEDIKYYGNRVESIVSIVNFVDAGGKKGVLKFREKIKDNEEFRNCKYMYYVDQDFDPVIEDPAIYVTPVYSIENLYTTKEAFQRIILNEFGLSRADDEYDICLALFEARQKDFHQAMLLINAWIACQRQLEMESDEEGHNVKLNLGNVKITDYVDIRLGYVQQKYTIDTLYEKFQGSHQIPSFMLEDKMSKLQQLEPQKVFRGKFELEFLRLFLEQLSKSARDGTEAFSQPLQVKLTITKLNILSDLSRFAETPDCLQKYVQRQMGLVGVS